MLKIHNTLTGSKEVFKPIEESKVRIYVCGMTVYDYLHIGHARMLVVFDMVTRYLRSTGLDVTYVRNITDIDDNIINRANENGESIQDLTERIIKEQNVDTEALAILPPDKEPRATHYMAEMIDIIHLLLEKKYAYQASNGDVFYDVSAFADYGKLSGKNIEDLRAGARVEVEEAKDDPLDFVLWKMAKPGEPSWESPWGTGRPGWHIECSAMSSHCLGDHFDIHCGGQDLQFPHHENEIAQSCAATGEKFVNVWMHNGFVRVDNEKMSKSLGNFFTVKQVLEKYKGEVIRFFILSSHYRSQINYSDVQLEEAKSALESLYLVLRDLPVLEGGKVNSQYLEQFQEAMDDDFNTSKAVAVLHDIAHSINRIEDKNSREVQDLATTLRYFGNILGILQDNPAEFLQSGSPQVEEGISNDEIDNLVQERTEAKEAKDYALADEIREILIKQGVILEDSSKGSTWRRK